MTWKQRQEQQLYSINQRFVPGGNLTLIIIMAIASVLIIRQILLMME